MPLFLRFVPETRRFLAECAQRGAHTESLLDAGIAPMRELFALDNITRIPQAEVRLHILHLLALAIAALFDGSPGTSW